MKKFKTICITATIIIVALGLYHNFCDTKQENTQLNRVITEQQSVIDSLKYNNNLLIDYYCNTENLLDSIFRYFVWQDVMDPYDYYDAVDNIYYEESLYKYLENKRRNVWKQ
jgi:hypothetical protein